MSNITQNFFDRVRYTIYSENSGSLIINEPIGWKEDDKEIARHETYDGIITKFSNNLKFVGEAKDFIFLDYELYGINSELRLVKDEKNPKTDLWERGYSGYLDMSTLNIEDGKLGIKFNSGGIEQILKSKENNAIEIDRITDLNGKTIAGILEKEITIDGREILLKSRFEKKDDYFNGRLETFSNDGNVRTNAQGVPFKLVSKSHEPAKDVTEQSPSAGSASPEIGSVFFAVSEVDRTLEIDINFSFKYLVTDFDDIEQCFFAVRLIRYNDGVNLNTISATTLYQHINPDYNVNAYSGSVNWQGSVFVGKNESLGLEYYTWANFEDTSFNRSRFYVSTGYTIGYISLIEKSFYEKTKSKILLPFEVADKLLEIYSGEKGLLKSDVLGRTDIGYSEDGIASLTSLTHGFWIRQFNKLPIPSEDPLVENNFKPLTLSLKDFNESFAAIWNLGFGIETVANKEKVVIEELSYFYNRNVTIKLPNQVKKVKRSIATDKYYSALEFGYEKGGSYLEAQGLDEFNAKSKFDTAINRLKNDFVRISKFRADAYGMEFARRKNFKDYSTEDTTYDNDIFVFDLKRNAFGGYDQRKWQDDFENEPTGIYSPQTAINLRFSPFNLMVRHGWNFGSGLTKYLTDYVRYISSTGNSRMKTKMSGKPEYSESGDIVNSELTRARYDAWYVEFEHDCNFEIMQQVNGKTNILGKDTMNLYGLVEFINENNEKEKGWLINLKPNGKGTWKILKSNK